MMQNHQNKLDSLWTTQWFSKQVSHVLMRIHICSPPFISRYTFSNKVVRKAYFFFFNVDADAVVLHMLHLLSQTQTLAHQP